MALVRHLSNIIQCDCSQEKQQFIERHQGLGLHFFVTQHGWAGEVLTLEAGQVIDGLLNLLQGLLNTQSTHVQLVCVADVCIPAQMACYLLQY